jgi:hypothetical protein
VDGVRKALIVANDEYEHEGLKHLLAPAADAEALGRVLGDAQIGDFDVHVVRNEPSHVIEGQIEDILSESRPDDVLLLHFSCHGLKSESGELFFAARNTRPNRLGSTAVSADFVQRCMRASRSRSIVLLLDCCYGGAFSQGVTVRASGDVNVLDSFPGGKLGGGRGRAVITASSAMEYAFEGDQLADDHSSRPSVFTSALVEGLATGDADRDQDGWVSLNELYDYIFDRVREQNPHQTPSRDVEMQGDLYVARRSRPVSTPSPLPSELHEVIDHPLARIRAGAVQELARLLEGRHAGLALAAKMALERLAHDDSRMVAAAAEAALAAAASDGDDPGTVLAPLPGDAEPPPATEEAPTAARLELSASVLDFGQLPQHGEPVPRTVRLSNAGGGTLDARATTSASWLDLRLVDDQLAVVVDTTAVGDHDGVITVDSNGGSAAIRVLATVTAPTTEDAPQTIHPESTPAGQKSGPSPAEAPETADKREPIGSRRTPSIPPRDPAAPDRALPPPDGRRPSDRRRRRLSTRARIVAGAGAGMALILIVVISVNAATNDTTSTPPPTAKLITTRPPAGEIIFQDHFATRTPGWEVTDPQGSGVYDNGKYRLHLDAADSNVSSEPTKERLVYPVAPASVLVDVRASLGVSEGEPEYGISCRDGDRGAYVFLIAEDDIQIGKRLNAEPWWNDLADVAPDRLGVNVNGENHLQAACIDEGQSVRLDFWVNGHGVEITDPNEPFALGTVGLIVGTGKQAAQSVDAEFDEFIVSRVS